MTRTLTAVALLCFSQLAAAATVTRGPFLQLADSTGITVVWRTDTSGLGRVRYGTSSTALSSQVAETTAGTTHVVRLTGLTPATPYFYVVDHDGAALHPQPYRFRTYPVPGSPEPFRFFAWGDSGTGNSNQLSVANRMMQQPGAPAFSLILGDIIYPDGEPQDYDPKYFQPYAALLRQMVIWPTIGNHDVHFDPQGGPYKDAYYLPTNNPAGTELYYSFDYGNAHFTCLDTHVNSYSSGSAQLQWAAQDLASSNATWKFVYFHVPPYSGGTHADSSSVKSSILPVLENAGADIVFAGHSHVYERTFLLKNDAIVQSDPSSYTKASATTGTLYVVSGNGGQVGGLSDPAHPMMAFQSGNTLGNTVVDVSGPVARGYFLKNDGTTLDLFNLTKGTDADAPRLIGALAPAATSVRVSFNEPVLAGSGAGGAENAARYTIAPSVNVSSALLLSDQRTVVLTTAAHTAGKYTVTAANVADRSGNTQTSTAADYEFGAATVDAGTIVDAGAPADAGTSTSTVDMVTQFAMWRYSVGSASTPSSWAAATFDDTTWAQGSQPLGYGETNLKTTVSMGTSLTLYARTEFDLAVTPSEFKSMTLDVDYDDGFVAFLNGTEIARRNVAAGQTYASTSTVSHESGTITTIDVSAHLTRLVPGDNYLAIETHNTNATSSDLLLYALLKAELGNWPDGGFPDAGSNVELDAGTGGEEGGGAGGGAGGGTTEEQDAGTSPGDGAASSGGKTCGCGSAGMPVFALLAFAAARFGKRRRLC